MSNDSEEWKTKLLADGIGTIHTNATGTTLHPGELARYNELGVYAYVRFPPGTRKVRIRLGTSLISQSQAWYNLDHELPDGTDLEDIVTELIDAWNAKVDRVQVSGGDERDKRILYTDLFHSSQYPAEHSEPLPNSNKFHYYSAYTDSIHKTDSQRYQSWSIWDIYRAQWGYLILFELERVVDMIHSLLDIYDQSGFLPMWANLAETNIMIGTHADSLIAEAVLKGIRNFDLDKAWEAVYKDATAPPEREDGLYYEDRQEHTPLEVRAGLSAYDEIGYVPLDGWPESTSRTLDYAVSVLASLLNKTDEATFFRKRSKNYRHVFNPAEGLMGARLRNGTFIHQDLPNPLGRQEGFTEGNMFDWTFAVPHDVPCLSALLGSISSLLALLDRHFSEGHNNQSNEPYHHIPFLYTLLGQPRRTQELIPQIAREAFSDQPDGYAGNEDCGQQSAWFFFVAAVGAYPVNPVSGELVVGASPFFDSVKLSIPGKGELQIRKGKGSYIKHVVINRKKARGYTLDWSDLQGEWVYHMIR